MSDISVERIIVALGALPFVIFTIVRLFIRENRLVDNMFIERATKELSDLRAEVDALRVELHTERVRADALEHELWILRRKLNLGEP